MRFLATIILFSISLTGISQQWYFKYNTDTLKTIKAGLTDSNWVLTSLRNNILPTINSDTGRGVTQLATGGSLNKVRDSLQANITASLRTFSTGLTNTGGTITSNISTGVSGGQTAIGGTASGNALTLSSTSNGTKGLIAFGASATTSSAYDEQNKFLGLVTNAPTHTLTLGSTSTGIAIYNTADQTTNYERLRIFYNSNVATIDAGSSGSGTARDLNINTNGTNFTFQKSGVTQFRLLNNNIVGGLNAPATLSSANTSSMGASGSYTNSSGINNALVAAITVNQTSTAGSRMLFISPFYQAAGSGSQLLIDAGTNSAGSAGGTHTSKFKVDNAGSTTIGGSLTLPYVAKTATYGIGAADYAIDCTSGTFTVTLPTSVGIAGKIYVISNSGAGVITIATTGSQTFTNVTATPTTLSLATLGSYTVMATGTNWIVL